MGQGSHAREKFIASDIAAIPQATTYVEGTDFTGLVIEVWDVDVGVIQGFVTGEATGANGDVDFLVVGSLDGVNWDTVAIATLTLTMSGANAIVESAQLNVEGYHSIKLLSIENKDAAKDATLVNLWFGKAYGGY